MAAEVRHPWFARLWALMSRKEPPQLVEHRQELLAGLTGRVLEVGAGSGSNFAHYPAGVAEVVALEPEPYLRDRAAAAGRAAGVAVTVREGTAEALPFADGEFDAAVACLVLCSVEDQAVALAELHRVLRPGGELRFYEHVRAGRPGVARAQRVVDRVFWPRAFGNCHTHRDTVGAIEAAGFAVESRRDLWEPPMPIALPVAPQVLGVARRA